MFYLHAATTRQARAKPLAKALENLLRRFYYGLRHCSFAQKGEETESPDSESSCKTTGDKSFRRRETINDHKTIPNMVCSSAALLLLCMERSGEKA